MLQGQSIIPVLCRLPQVPGRQRVLYSYHPNSSLLNLRTSILRRSALSLRVPRSSIAQFAPTLTLTLTSSSEFLGQIFRRNLLQQLRLIITAQNRNFANGDLVQKELDRGPYSRKEAWRIDDVEFAHAFGVSVLANIRSPCE